jgi:hypothetical protein
VIEAYRDAGIDVVRTEEEDLPPVSLAELKAQYPELAGVLDKAQARKMFGIAGSGPWRVVLARYVLNALDRTEHEIRSTAYCARVGDGFFPPRRIGALSAILGSAP